MFNWNVDEERFKKEDPKGYKLWRLTQLINYGFDGEKRKLYSLPTSITFWNWPPKKRI